MFGSSVANQTTDIGYVIEERGVVSNAIIIGLVIHSVQC